MKKNSKGFKTDNGKYAITISGVDKKIFSALNRAMKDLGSVKRSPIINDLLHSALKDRGYL